MTLFPTGPTSLSRSGFTLIEVLVSVAIMILLLGGGIAAYINVDRRQSLQNVCAQMTQYVRTAQKRARVGDKPAGCDTLTSYDLVQTATSPDVVSIRAVCLSGTYTVEEYEIPTIFSLDEFTAMSFLVLHGGVDETDVVISSSSPNYRCEFTVESGGSVTTPTITSY